MKIVDRYIGQSVLTSLIVVLLVIVGLEAVFAFIGEVQDLENNYRAPQALVYIGLTFPRRFYEFLPPCTLIACLIGLGSLASTSELTVLRSAGVSIVQIVKAALRPIVIASVVALLLAQFVVPNSERYAETYRAMAIGSGQALQVHGHWGREENSFLHVNVIEPNGVLYGVTQYQFDDSGQLIESSFSDRAIYQGSYWVMENVKKTYFEEEKTRTEVIPTIEWHTKMTPRILALLSSEPDYMSISGLFSYARYLEKQGLSTGQYYLSFWRKILQPISTIAMVFIAASFVFGPLRTVTMGQRVTTGVIVGLVFQYFQDFLGQISLVFSMPPFFAAFIPVLLCIATAGLLLKRIR